ncbi:MAG: EF-hand domain-containing protein [bacterium]|nr:EF-hand domain-containing protein [bacterium]
MRAPKLAVALLPVFVATACGMNPAVAPATSTVSNTGFEAAATRTLRDGFRNIHMAIFTKIDGNGDGYIDEYEAGPFFSLTREFPNADKTKSGKRGNGKISKAEFMRYATAGGLLSGKDTPSAFTDRMRAFIAQAFTRLDRPEGGKWFGKGDGYLSTEEISDAVIAKLGLGFAYDKIHVRVVLPGFSPDDISASDKTGDGKLSQGEFEDLYMISVAKGINPNFSPDPNPAPPAPPAPVDPAPAPAPIQGPVLPVIPH